MTAWDAAPWAYSLLTAVTLVGLIYVWGTSPFLGRPKLARFVPLVFAASVLWPLTLFVVVSGAAFLWWRDYERQKRTRAPRE